MSSSFDYLNLNTNVLFQESLSFEDVTVGFTRGRAEAGPCSEDSVQGCDAGEL